MSKVQSSSGTVDPLTATTSTMRQKLRAAAESSSAKKPDMRRGAPYMCVAASRRAAVFTLGERYDASILNRDPIVPSMAHPTWSPKPMRTRKPAPNSATMAACLENGSNAPPRPLAWCRSTWTLMNDAKALSTISSGATRRETAPVAADGMAMVLRFAASHCRYSGVPGASTVSRRSRRPGSTPSQIFHTSRNAHPMFLFGAPWKAWAPSWTMRATVLM
mmetsp:Transcript_32211/g.108464  ORF Transcript_32211/g.108464 Transcript_32211/m.108464 type:complete len:219 (-) Transcript_32211:1702-2358(-)